MDPLPKWKTTLGSIGGAFTGLAMIATAIAAEELDVDRLLTGIGFVTAALAAFGIGKKIERNGG